MHRRMWVRSFSTRLTSVTFAEDIKERTQTSANMGKGHHVVIHDIIHDDNEMGNRPISYQDVALHEYCNFQHNLGNWLIDNYTQHSK